MIFLHCRKNGKETIHSFFIVALHVAVSYFRYGMYRTLDQFGKLEKFKKEMQKNAVSLLGVIQVRWKGQSEIRSGGYMEYYSREKG
jgi:hypothetical protein